MINSTTLAKLNEQPWEELLVQLHEYTDFLLKRYRIRYSNVVLPKGYDAQMIVYEAIESLYTGRRAWDFEAKPDFKLFISTQVIRSIVWNLFVSKENELIKELVLHNEEDEDADINPLELLIADESNILENIYEREFLARAEQLINQLDKAPEHLVIKVYEGRLSGMKNKQIAHDLGIPVNVVEAVMKRIRNILLPLFQ
jgi:DNA-directed RNA polymerase specialized sigma24 family protein